MADWTQYVGEEVTYRQEIIGDVIVGSAWAVSPKGPTVIKTFQDAAATAALLSGVRAGVVYTLQVTITTAGGQTLKPRCTVQGLP